MALFTAAIVVSIHAPVRGATWGSCSRCLLPAQKCFNPRPRAGGDCRAIAANTPAATPRRCFNPRPRAGGDHAAYNAKSSQLIAGVFQSTPPCGGRRTSHARLISDHAMPVEYQCGGFNPRPRAGGDYEHGRPSGRSPVLGIVSIHAPVRGATLKQAGAYLGENGFNPRPRAGGDLAQLCEGAPIEAIVVSIHAPVRGATWSSGHNTLAIACFNPRPRAGGDDSVKTTRSEIISVSIHAPVRGATTGILFQSALRGTGRSRFNPRPRAGGDSRSLGEQSTPPCGGNTAPSDPFGPSGFNPRPRAGGDPSSRIQVFARRRCFNPRPRAGGGDTHGARIVHALRPIRFQSTPPCGGRPGICGVGKENRLVFQSTPPCGGRQGDPAASYVECSGRFNPRPRAGGDSAINRSSAQSSRRVSIHAPVRGATRLLLK
jgi:hypothetical protein